MRKVNFLGFQNGGDLMKIVIQVQVLMTGQEQMEASWGYFFTHHMAKLARLYDRGMVNNLEQRMELILNKMNSDMLDPNDLIYKDILYYPNTDDQVFYSPHRGYVNLFPLGLGLIDKSRVDIIQQHINFMRSSTMWTQFGIRSLETNSTEFRKKSNYWTGPIWINIQFLVLRGLKLYYWEIDGVQSFYHDLRQNMIETICSQYETRGYFYEHYNQNLDGLGQGNRPFNGWTSLITLIIHLNLIILLQIIYNYLILVVAEKY